MRHALRIAGAALAASFLMSWGSGPASAQSPAGARPTDETGRALNLNFEDGTLRDWKAEGTAFRGNPVKGDAVYKRRNDQTSGHAGEYWAGSFESGGDDVKGTLTSVTFEVTKPWCSFLVGGGLGKDSAVELIRADTDKPFFRVGGENDEHMKRIAVELKEHVGKPIYIRLVDNAKGGWGHINFDDFLLHDEKPSGPLRDAPPPPDVYAHSGLTGEEAANAMTLPPGFRAQLFAGEPDIIQPIAMTIDEKGRLWVVESYAYPLRQPEGQGKDRVLIFEDENGDGKFDTRKVFADNLNLVSGIEVGFGGVWIGAAPNLLFLADADKNDKADGEPTILLDGWGYEDTHETLNSFIWGPDGWLYGCHGVFTHSRVGKPGTPDSERKPINAGIWRYHPTRHEFEVFAEGTSNPWGVDFDPNGQCIIEACVIPHLYHMIQGGRYERQAGQHFNPYTYDDIKTIADHRHYLGANPHGGNGRSDSAGGGHAHSGLISYQGGAWPAEYNGGLFMNNIHGARLNRDVLAPAGSGFVGQHAPDFLMANDAWSQIVYFRTGPDGNLFMIDWYDENQCHRTDPADHDRTNGRIFKVSYGNSKAPRVDLSKLPSVELVELLQNPNQWYVRTARRILQERGDDAATTKSLVHGLETLPDAAGRLRSLWALGSIVGLKDEQTLKALGDENAYVRSWAIQLATEKGVPSPAVLTRLIGLAKSDDSPVVRLYLASASQRLPVAHEARWAIVEALSQHAEDANDHNLPLMYWFALEPMAGADPGRALELATKAKVSPLLSYTVRRIGAIGTPESIAALVEALNTPGANRLAMVRGINDALQGRRSVDMPAGWPKVYESILASTDAELKSRATALALTFGDPKALAAQRETLANKEAPLAERLEALASLRKARDPQLAAALRGLLSDAALRSPALKSLADFDDKETPGAILTIYEKLGAQERRDALGTLATRLPWAVALVDAVAASKVPSKDLSADLVRQLRNLNNAPLNDRLEQVWGKARETTADKAKIIAAMKQKLTSATDTEPDTLLGRAVFVKTCAQCHKLFASGADIAPELTGSNRADLDYILSNVLDPSALIGKDYQAHLVATADGRVLTGLVKAEDNDAITLVTATETVIIPKQEIDERKLSEQSMMPEDLWANLNDHEIRSLVAYLASPAQVALTATPETAASFFNGNDLTGWNGDPKIWSVENGEIVGKTEGLQHNAFLISDLAAGDFELTLKMKLTPNSENSGIQFRSEPAPEGEVKGYQADAGQGWWGKLYEELGRGLLWDKSGEAHVKPNEWNDYRIVARGPRIQTFINGQPCVDLEDTQGSRQGVFAFQAHAGGALEVRFKDIRLAVPKPKVEGERAGSE